MFGYHFNVYRVAEIVISNVVDIMTVDVKYFSKYSSSNDISAVLHCQFYVRISLMLRHIVFDFIPKPESKLLIYWLYALI